MLDRSTISSTANSYVFVAKVSKLNGLSISVMGNSFIKSTKHSKKAVSNANLFSGKYSFLARPKLPKPRFFADSDKLSGILSKLDLIGDFPTAINRMKYA